MLALPAAVPTTPTLMGMPQEVRDQIYEEVLGDAVLLVGRPKLNSPALGYFPTMPAGPPPINVFSAPHILDVEGAMPKKFTNTYTSGNLPAILEVSVQVRAEAMKVFNASTSVAIIPLPDFSANTALAGVPKYYLNSVKDIYITSVPNEGQNAFSKLDAFPNMERLHVVLPRVGPLGFNCPAHELGSEARVAYEVDIATDNVMAVVIKKWKPFSRTPAYYNATLIVHALHITGEPGTRRLSKVRDRGALSHSHSR